MVVVVHRAVPPNIVYHPIDLLAQGETALFFNHLDELLLEIHVDLLVVQNPSEKADLELFYESLLIGQEFE